MSIFYTGRKPLGSQGGTALDTPAPALYRVTMKRRTPEPSKTSFRHPELRPFRKTGLLEAALTHPSFQGADKKGAPEQFGRLEFFGDAILNFVICRALFKLFPAADEGELSRLRSTLVSRKILARIAGELKIKPLLRLGPGVKNEPPQAQEKLLADSLESLIAAIFLDQGLARTEKFLGKIFSLYLNAGRLNRLDPNPKGSLQILCQRHWQKLPSYKILRSTKGVTVEVEITEVFRASSEASTRKAAEIKAARKLTAQIRQAFSGALKKSSERKLSSAR